MTQELEIAKAHWQANPIYWDGLNYRWTRKPGNALAQIPGARRGRIAIPFDGILEPSSVTHSRSRYVAIRNSVATSKTTALTGLAPTICRSQRA